MGEEFMIDIPMRTKGALNQNTLLALNTLKTGRAYCAQDIEELNRGPAKGSAGRNSAEEAASEGPAESPVSGVLQPVQMRIPSLVHPLRKGQKVPLPLTSPVRRVDVCLGWNSTDARCDVDVSAFLLRSDGKVLGDDWFVFYGQTKSPDGKVIFEVDGLTDREVIRLDLEGLDPEVKKAVFVLTINEAVEKGLNFGMLKDAYIRILDHGTRAELVSFQMTEYYTNVISMMIGELYLHNGSWKFHGIGNGVAKDLAGLCRMYGVQVSG